MPTADNDAPSEPLSEGGFRYSDRAAILWADPIKKRAETEYLKRFDVEEEAPTSGLMCSSCDDRFQLALFEDGAA